MNIIEIVKQIEKGVKDYEKQEDAIYAAILFVEEKMNDAGIKSILDDKYSLKTIGANYSDTSLYLSPTLTEEEEYYSGEITVRLCSNLSATRESSYINGDFNAEYNRPNLSDLTEFVEAFPDILLEISETITSFNKSCKLIVK